MSARQRGWAQRVRQDEVGPRASEGTCLAVLDRRARGRGRRALSASDGAARRGKQRRDALAFLAQPRMWPVTVAVCVARKGSLRLEERLRSVSAAAVILRPRQSRGRVSHSGVKVPVPLSEKRANAPSTWLAASVCSACVFMMRVQASDDGGGKTRSRAACTCGACGSHGHSVEHERAGGAWPHSGRGWPLV